MENKTRQFAGLIGSGWMFGFALVLFTSEAAWLALTTRFPMAFDEAYHLGLIQFFSHHLNPIISNQSADTYKYGAIVQNSSFLYHYLLSFAYRFMALFTHSVLAQVIGLRLINVGLIVASLFVIKKLLRLLKLSPALANLVVLAFALTPIVTALAAQINYDNLLILLTSLSLYQMVLFIKQLDQKNFDTKDFLILVILCLSASLVKFSFLPILASITIVVVWKFVAIWRQDSKKLKTSAKTSFKKINQFSKLALLSATVVFGLLFARFYGVDVVKYHNPVPQCNQVLSIQACKQYYSWDTNYNNQRYNQAHPSTAKMNILHFTSYWSVLNGFQLYGEIMPLKGVSYVSVPFLLILYTLSAAAVAATIVNFKKIKRNNKYLLAVSFVCLIYVLSLLSRNYHDYLQLGQPSAISGRYLVPILAYLYALFAVGLHHALEGETKAKLFGKAGLAAVIVAAFVYFGGYSQYSSQITPVYGRLNANNDFKLDWKNTSSDSSSAN